MATFIPYQVDFSVKNTAKTLGFSKKKVQFKFGFANPEACREGLTGAQCRGSEHELTFVWSLASGKRNLFVDGKEVHYSESGQNGWTQDRAWQHVFSLREGNDRYRVHFISQPRQPEFPDVQPFDLRVNGVSYFQFNKIFELGTPRMRERDVEARGGGGRSYNGGGRDSPMSPEERKAVAAAKLESLRDLRQSGSHGSAGNQGVGQQAQVVREENLLSFDEPPTAPPPMQQHQMVAAAPPADGSSYGVQYASGLTVDSSFDSQQRMNLQGSFGNQYGQQPPAQTYGGPYNYGQSQPNGTYGAPGAAYGGTYGQQQPSPAGYGSYGAPPAYMQPPLTGSFTGAPSTDTTGNGAALTPYQPAAGAPAPSPYALNPLQSQSYETGAIYGAEGSSLNQPFQPALASPSAQSYVSYGSAPSFAQPPRPVQPPPAPTNNFAAPPAMYGQPPPSSSSYGAPPFAPPQPPTQPPQPPYGQPPQSTYGY